MDDRVRMVRRVVTRALGRPRSLTCLALGAGGIFLSGGWTAAWLVAFGLLYAASAVESLLDETFILESLDEAPLGLPMGEDALLPEGEATRGGEGTPLTGERAESFRSLKRLVATMTAEIGRGETAGGEDRRRPMAAQLEAVVAGARRLLGLRERLERRAASGGLDELQRRADELRLRIEESSDEEARRRWIHALELLEANRVQLGRLRGAAERLDGELAEMRGELELVASRLVAADVSRRADPVDGDDLPRRLGEIVDEVAALEESLSGLGF